MTGALSADAFCRLVEAEFGVGGPPVTPETGLYDELALDSFAALRLVFFVEDLADVGDVSGDVPPLFTVGDAYAYLCSLHPAGCRAPVPTRAAASADAKARRTRPDS